MSLESLDKAAESEASGSAEQATADVSARRVYRFVDDGLAAIGGIEVAAGICGINRGDLRRSLDRDGRRLAVEHVMLLGARIRRYNATLATELGAALVRPMDLLAFPRVTMTDKERADRLERAMRSAPLGEAWVEKVLGGPL